MAENSASSGRKSKPRKKKTARKSPGGKQICGIVMPISAIDGCLEQHWADVREILEESVTQAGFEPRLVSDADDVGIIQKRIIQNVYNDPIVVCDVSGKNPNVMFELGMRLAFDKPTIIVKDDKTAYSFDTAPIEHLEYPRDLRFSKIVEFGETLTEKIVATHKKAQTDKSYTTFLKHFGSFSPAKVEARNVDRDVYILDELQSLKSLVLRQGQKAMDEVEPSPAHRAHYRQVGVQNLLHDAVRRALRRSTAVRKHGSRKALVRSIGDEVLRTESGRVERYFSTRGQFDRAIASVLAELA